MQGLPVKAGSDPLSCGLPTDRRDDLKRIYVADDEADIRRLIESFLKAEGYEVEGFASGDKLLEAFDRRPADLLVLDIMMPGMDGLSLCAAIRRRSDVPIILLTARDTDADMITGFTMGCDDYFTKPFSMVKLMLRVKAIFSRMADESGAEALSFGDLTLRPLQRTAWRGDEELKLTNTEFSLLEHLLKNRDKVVSREELLNLVWGYDSFVETRATDDIVKRLRKKLSAASSGVVIETVWGIGFRLKKTV